MKKISVIIPCFNVTKWLPKCFLSLVNQTIGVENLELIFINDASTDNGETWNMLVELEKAYPESIIIIDLPENRRQGGARNEGLKYASGEYISFVDADDWVDEKLYEKVYLCAKKQDADIVQFNHSFYFDSVGIVENTQVMPDEFIHIKNDDDRKKMLMAEKLTYGCWNKIYRREMLIKAGVQYAEHVIYEEPLFVYPLLFYGTKFVMISDSLYIYRQNSMGTMRNDMKAKDTLLQHAKVQQMVWEFMKKTPFFERFYEEIKLYFLHTYLYETMDFAKKREIEVDLSYIAPLIEYVKVHVKEYDKSLYSSVVPMQMKLYQQIESGITKQWLEDYIKII